VGRITLSQRPDDSQGLTSNPLHREQNPLAQERHSRLPHEADPHFRTGACGVAGAKPSLAVRSAGLALTERK